MNETLTNSLQLARLLYQKGDFLEALAAFEKAQALALAQKEFSSYLDCIRIQMQCLAELERSQETYQFLEKISPFLADEFDASLKARASYLLTFHNLQQNQIEEAKTYLSQTIAFATQSQDLEYLARSLTLEVHIYASLARDWDFANRSLEKLETILQSIDLPEVEIWALVTRAHIASQNSLFEQASALVWKAYQMAQNKGNHLTMPGLLLLLGRIHNEIGQRTQAQIYFDLCMAGIDPKKHPRQYRIYSKDALSKKTPGLLQFDFIVNIESRLIRERTRGHIDFKNQHLLLDLALMFMKNPGVRFSKEEVLENIWKQAYDPSMHDNLIYVSIKRLRTLIEPDIENPRYILRDRRGYYLSPACSINFELQPETNI
ncbi:winged helix-turn-helix domain-containing protein [Bdellovibrio sp. HCB2-146]|uniref:winged helix-turn-helix domain-containing protein n=1 Tax=Bdellovibrio sp. HCB2-146 TaxID=3394362 RepID=UPI0039BD8D3E